MFVVYSPEGNSRIRSLDTLPELKMSKSHHASEEDELDRETFKLNERSSSPEYIPSAVHKYNKIQNSDERKLVVKAYEIMSQPVINIRSSELLSYAWQLMKKSNISHLPVRNEVGNLVGIVSSYEILTRVILDKEDKFEEVRSQSVKDVMINNVVTTKSETDIRKVAYVMSFYKISCVPIMSEAGDVIGIVTVADILKRVSEDPPLKLYI
jgi:acetoin utilization protein AcuB